MTDIGHNSVNNDQLRSIVERVENVNEEISGLQSDRNEIFREASGHGYDVKTLRAIIRIRKESPEDRASREAVLETYLHALGMT
jgi:uncharacterized protein (UPF0335 family)